MIGNLKLNYNKDKTSEKAGNDYLDGKISIVEYERRQDFEGEEKQDKRTIAELNKIEAKDRKAKAEEKLGKLQEEQKKKENKIIEELSNPNKLDDSELEKERRNLQRDMEASEREALQEFVDPNYLDDTKFKKEVRKEEVRQLEEEFVVNEEIKEPSELKYDGPVTVGDEAESSLEEQFVKDSINNDIEDKHEAVVDITENINDNTSIIIEEDFDAQEETEVSEDTQLDNNTETINDVEVSSQSLESNTHIQEITFEEDEEDEIIDFGTPPIKLDKNKEIIEEQSYDSNEHIDSDSINSESTEIHSEVDSINNEIQDNHVEDEHITNEIQEKQNEEINAELDNMVNSFNKSSYGTFVGEDERDLENQHLYLNEGTYQEPIQEIDEPENTYEEDPYNVKIEEDQMTGDKDDPYKIMVSSDQMMGDEEDRFKITTELTDYSDRFTGVLAKYRVDGGYGENTQAYHDNQEEIDYERQIEEYTQQLIDEEEAQQHQEEDEDLSIYTSALGGYADSIIQDDCSGLTFQHEYDIGTEEDYDDSYSEENYTDYNDEYDDSLYYDDSYNDNY